MTLFEEIVLEGDLLTENVSVDSINSAIDGLHPVWITYDDTEDGQPPASGSKGKARRLIYPVAYGLSKKNNEVIRAFQPEGSTKRGVPKWKFFRVDRIKFWRTITSRQYDPETLVGFNEDGDKSMTVVYTIAPIGNAKNIKRNTVQPEQPQSAETRANTTFNHKPITKDEVENIEIPQEQPQKQKVTAKNIVNSIINYIKNFPQKIKEKKLDIKQQKSNINTGNTINTGDTINAPETTPVTKQEIGVSKNDVQQPKVEKQQNPTPTTEPVTKQEIGNKDEEILDNLNNEDLRENKLTKSFLDLTERMNNLYKF